MVNTRQLQFDKGIMRLSAYDPVSNQYETRTLTLPELPLMESLEHLFNNTNITPTASLSTTMENTGNKLLRLTKSCNNKKSSKRNSIRHDVVLTPRRCQSNPNLSKQQQMSFKATATSIQSGRGPMRSKRSLSSAFHAVAGFLQKANKKIRSTYIHDKEWSAETWLDEIRLSSDSSISTLDLVPVSTWSSTRSVMPACENWWTGSPPISSF
ncbi:hypothetical protein MAM1_0006d00774 [Mucor ambiguus]|uniref:Uncharacterized protein n=1 Tax=Mucor ambiguus TaxID=91626 RepID=A0A0C9M087_9FUNG|nr:hypothetical protein MAM1_0006d00774 [Mucor ambiguus]